MIGAVERIAAPRPNVAQGVGFVNRGLTLARTGFDLLLRGAHAHPERVEGRGSLNWAEHTSGNRRCYRDPLLRAPLARLYAKFRKSIKAG